MLVGYGYWKTHLGAAQDLSQAHLKIDGAVYAVIGVIPAEFRFPADVDLWIPTDLDGESSSRTSHNYEAVGRLRDGVTVQQANSDISTIARHIHESSSEQNDYLLKDGTAVPLQKSITGGARPALLVLLFAVGFLLLVACANVANLLLAQAAARGQELAIRTAIGAMRKRLVRQFVTEAFLLSLAGGALGVVGAVWGVKELVAHAPESLPRLESVAVSLPVLLFALAVSAAVATGLGAFTAVRATSGDLRKQLMEGGRGQAGSKDSQRLRTRDCGDANCHHAGAGGGSGVVRTEFDKSAGSESGFSRGQSGDDGCVSSVGRGCEDQVCTGNFLRGADRPAETNSRNEKSWRNERTANGRGATGWHVFVNDAKGRA